MARTCTICAHEQRVAIDTALIDGTSNRRIAAHYGLAETSIRRHKSEHLAQILAESVEMPTAPVQPTQDTEVRRIAAQRQGRDQITAQDLMAQLTRQVERVNLLSDAVDDWLRDPEDPSRYTIVPRAEDVTVIYSEHSEHDDHPRRKKARLSELLGRLEGGGLFIEATETKHADPRELLLKTADGMKGQMQLLLSVLEKLHTAQEVAAFQDTVLTAIGEAAPDVRRSIEERLRQRQPLGRSPGPAQW